MGGIRGVVVVLVLAVVAVAAYALSLHDVQTWPYRGVPLKGRCKLHGAEW
jgi:hypothetical protein